MIQPEITGTLQLQPEISITVLICETYTAGKSFDDN